MHPSRSLLVRLTLLGVVGFVLAQACGANSSGDANGGTGGTSGSSNASGGSKLLGSGGTAPQTDGGDPGLDPRCGVDRLNGCVPDDAKSCVGYAGPPIEKDLLSLGGVGGQTGENGGVAGEVGRAGEAGVGGTSGGWEGGGAGGQGAGGAAGASGGSTWEPNGGAAGASGPPEYACRVHGTGPAVCLPTGHGTREAPCFSSADCDAGLACVNDGAVARCRPYCCRGEASCDGYPGTYCTSRPQADDSGAGGEAGASAMLVPVCVPADQCDLSDPYPCPAGRSCQCAPGTACLVVRPDATTSCAAPGSGALGESCPCAHGLVCSQGASAHCVALCMIQGGDSSLSCKTGKCQASAELPSGWGVCVGN